MVQASSNFSVSRITDHVSRYERLGQYFHLANRGDAINFIHNAEVGPYIYLVQGEVIAAINYLCTNSVENKIVQLPMNLRKDLAQRWLSHFG